MPKRPDAPGRDLEPGIWTNTLLPRLEKFENRRANTRNRKRVPVHPIRASEISPYCSWMLPRFAHVVVGAWPGARSCLGTVGAGLPRDSNVRPSVSIEQLVRTFLSRRKAAPTVPNHSQPFRDSVRKPRPISRHLDRSSRLRTSALSERRELAPLHLLQGRGDSRERRLDVFTRVEGADADMAFAAFSEAGAGRADDLGFVQQCVEELL